jgi:hypothetical protein
MSVCLSTLHEDLCTFMIMYRWIILKLRKVSDEFVGKIKPHILCSKASFRKSCLLWDNVENYGTARQATDDNIIWRMRFACWVTKAIDTHSEYVILIAFPRQQWLRQRAPMLYYTYIACLLIYIYIYSLVHKINWFANYNNLRSTNTFTVHRLTQKNAIFRLPYVIRVQDRVSLSPPVADGKRPRGRAEGGSGRQVNYLLWNLRPPQFQIEFEEGTS